MATGCALLARSSPRCCPRTDRPGQDGLAAQLRSCAPREYLLDQGEADRAWVVISRFKGWPPGHELNFGLDSSCIVKLRHCWT